ncbi:MAG: DUF3604 domain-containing protein [Pseudomonadota bacterium]
MPPINPAEMGDVWPAAEPGRPGDYGRAVLHPTGPVEIRSYQTLTVTYTCGKFGLDDTGAIKIGFRWVHDRGPLQCDDPSGPNYVTATASNGVPLTIYVERYGYRPWDGVRITVNGGYMHEGDTITVRFGDTSQGSPGCLMPTIAESAHQLKVSVDACATGHFAPLDDALCLAIVAGSVERWHVTAPTLRRPGETFFIGIRAEDIWGNPATPGETVLHLHADGPVDGLPETFHFSADQQSVEISGLVIADEGTARIHLSGPDGTPLANSNPIMIREGDYAAYWGDLHGQSGETVGMNTIDEYMDFARNIAFLDVCGHQANDFQITNAFWQRINDLTTELDEDGRFTVYPGYEWSGNTPVGGDHNVFFRHADRQIVRSSHAELTDRSDLHTDANTLDTLFDALRSEDAVVWSHVGGRPADVSYAHDPTLKTAVEVHSNWGTFEWILTDSLALGHRIGVVSNSDGHKGRPGAGPPGATEFGAYGGLTCFLAPELTRDAIFECIRRRHHYGTSGSRIGLSMVARFSTPVDLFPRDPRHFKIDPIPSDTAMMGDIVHLKDQDVELAISVDAPAPIERIDVVHGADLVHTFRPYTADDLGNRVRVYWQGAEYRGRGRNTHWQGSITAEGCTIEAMTKVNHWNHERLLELRDGQSLMFDAVTSGNFAGVDLMLSGDGTLRVDTNLTEGAVGLSDLGLEDHVLDAGGLDRMIRIRRLPDQMDAHSMNEALPLNIAPGTEAAIWVRITTLDGHQAWSSPIYLERH